MSKCFADRGDYCDALNEKKCEGCKFKKPEPKCFADKGDICLALNVKDCEGCNFKKERMVAVRELEGSPIFAMSPALKRLRDEILSDEAPKWLTRRA